MAKKNKNNPSNGVKPKLRTPKSKIKKLDSKVTLSKVSKKKVISKKFNANKAWLIGVISLAVLILAFILLFPSITHIPLQPIYTILNIFITMIRTSLSYHY